MFKNLYLNFSTNIYCLQNCHQRSEDFKAGSSKSSASLSYLVFRALILRIDPYLGTIINRYL